MINSTQFYNSAKHTLGIKSNSVKESNMTDEQLVCELLNNFGTLLRTHIDVSFHELTIAELLWVLSEMSQRHKS